MDSLETYLPEDQRERFRGFQGQASELQATALRVLDEYEAEAREHEEKIRELRGRRIPALKSMYNTGVLINQLPIELLTHIFRAAGPRTTSPAGAMRLTHVCRYWRSVIHHTPTFWADFLNSDKVMAREEEDSLFVLAALDRSMPVPRLRFSMSSDFVYILQTVPAHVSRITTLLIDCTMDARTSYSDIRSLFNLQMPHLEDLTFWLYDCHNDGSVDEATVPCPRLRRLRTNCCRFSLDHWVGPALRELWLGSNRKRFSDLEPEPEPCCVLFSLDNLWDALARCPDLKRLGLDECLDYSMNPPTQLPVLAFPGLEVLQLVVERTDMINLIVDHMLLPAGTDIRLVSDCEHHSLDVLVPTRHPLLCIPTIRRLVVDIGDADNALSLYGVWGGADEGVHRLSLHTDDGPEPSDEDFDLLRFFRGFAPVFPSSSITYLEINCFDTFTDNGGFDYLFRHYPHLSRLVVLDLRKPTRMFAAVAEQGVLPRLQQMEIRVVTKSQSIDDERETMVSMLEARASHGKRLERFSFGEIVHCQRRPVPSPMDDPLVRRLEAIVQELSIREPYREIPKYNIRRHGELVWGS